MVDERLLEKVKGLKRGDICEVWDYGCCKKLAYFSHLDESTPVFAIGKLTDGHLCYFEIFENWELVGSL